MEDVRCPYQPLPDVHSKPEILSCSDFIGDNLEKKHNASMILADRLLDEVFSSDSPTESLMDEQNSDERTENRLQSSGGVSDLKSGETLHASIDGPMLRGVSATESENPQETSAPQGDRTDVDKSWNDFCGEKLNIKVKVEISPGFGVEEGEFARISANAEEIEDNSGLNLKLEQGCDSDSEYEDGSDRMAHGFSIENVAENTKSEMGDNTVHIIIDRSKEIADYSMEGDGSFNLKFEVLSQDEFGPEAETRDRNSNQDPDFTHYSANASTKKLLQRTTRKKIQPITKKKPTARKKPPLKKKKQFAKQPPPLKKSVQSSPKGRVMKVTNEIQVKPVNQVNEKESNDEEKQSSFVCDICGRVFAHKSAVNQHRRAHKNQDLKEVICNVCGKICPSRRRLEQHWQNVHSPDRPHPCDMCTLTFKSKSNLRRHAQTHTGEKPEKRFQCDVCDQTFLFKCKLEEHILRHEMERPFECKECGKAYKWKEMLKDHEKIHRDPNAHTCQICNRAFTCTLNLNRHKRLHEGEGQSFVCDLCGKVLATSSSLVRHIGIHDAAKSGEYRFYCPHCDKGFTVKANLERHVLSHQGIKPFRCEVCEKLFSQKASLNSHRLIHTGDRPYSCDYCDKTFIQKSNLKTHMQKHNGQFTLGSVEGFMEGEVENCITESVRMKDMFPTVPVGLN